MAGPLLGFDEQRVVVSVSGAHKEIDGCELREWPERLRARDGWLFDDSRTARDVVGIGYLIAQRTALRSKAG